MKTMENVELQVISNVVMETLLGDMKKMPEQFGSFRYFMFAKRLVAATYGREDAVIWANDWYCDLYDEAMSEMEATFKSRAICREIEFESHAQFLAGKVGNPRYQLYLDTVEDTASIHNHCDYFAWCADISMKYQKTYPKTFLKNLENAKEHFSQFEHFISNERLSDRVKRERVLAVLPDSQINTRSIL